jgi:hypothetical protein
MHAQHSCKDRVLLRQDQSSQHRCRSRYRSSSVLRAYTFFEFCCACLTFKIICQDRPPLHFVRCHCNGVMWATQAHGTLLLTAWRNSVGSSFAARCWRQAHGTNARHPLSNINTSAVSCRCSLTTGSTSVAINATARSASPATLILPSRSPLYPPAPAVSPRAPCAPSLSTAASGAGAAQGTVFGRAQGRLPLATKLMLLGGAAGVVALLATSAPPAKTPAPARSRHHHSPESWGHPASSSSPGGLGEGGELADPLLTVVAQSLQQQQARSNLASIGDDPSHTPLPPSASAAASRAMVRHTNGAPEGSQDMVAAAGGLGAGGLNPPQELPHGTSQRYDAQQGAAQPALQPLEVLAAGGMGGREGGRRDPSGPWVTDARLAAAMQRRCGLRRVDVQFLDVCFGFLRGGRAS